MREITRGIHKEITRGIWNLSAYTTTSIWYILFFLYLFQLVNFVWIQCFFNDLLKERSHFCKLVLSQKEKKFWKIPTKTSIRVGHNFTDIVLRILLTFSENFFECFRKPLDDCFQNYRNRICLSVYTDSLLKYCIISRIKANQSTGFYMMKVFIERYFQTKPKNVWSPTS